jgi:putative endonuclease
MAEHNEFGKAGENDAAEFLIQNGHEILAKNYRFGKAEIDIISKDAHVIVFTEVKARATDYFGYPEEAVTKAKRKRMVKVAEEYMSQNKLRGSVRFDIIAITQANGKSKIHHIRDAFFNEADDEVYQ